MLENKLDIHCWAHFLRAIAFGIDSDLKNKFFLCDFHFRKIKSPGSNFPVNE